jgi:hypothetical protein
MKDLPRDVLQRSAIHALFNLGLTTEGGKVPAIATGRTTIAGLAVAVATKGPYQAGIIAATAGIDAKDAVKAALIAKQYLNYTYTEHDHGKQRAEGAQDRPQREAPLEQALPRGA